MLFDEALCYLFFQLIFYVVMGLENAMLMFIWIIGVGVSETKPWYHVTLPLAVFVMFFSGLGFMWLYYRYFHVRRLKYEAGGRFNSNNNNVAVDSSVTPEALNTKSDDYSSAGKVSAMVH